ncbi:ATP-binding cassette domain-containing protein [Paenibacillus sp. L3-i20]|uniref:ABC transporter ATP-binding protein n=1 Tax=Paenibacillus sp. L3-i20 TaxID=2905833 RepID=UPI001EDD9B4E|nr:ABC transporter ATP-binding protein [Paenibacillus sp. L3-i20]GKU78915.1 ABC transporter ATP-binding protein [Paenibacillus sp. L3-i20]
MISVNEATYSYENVSVLQKISFEENEPVIAGLWGRNGAGKTTLMRLLAGHQQPDHGTIHISGMVPYGNSEAMKHICYMQEDHPFSSIWTVNDALRFGRYFNVNWDQNTADSLVSTFNLDGKKKITRLSKGMKSALQFIVGLSSRASVTIFDEPTNGLDAAMRKQMYKSLRESHEEMPRLILISTHHIEEVQPLCESLIVMHEGKLLLHQPMDEVRENGIWLAGEKNTIVDIIKGHNILEQTTMGFKMRVMIDAPYSKQWKDHAHTHGLSIEKADVQDYLLNLTEKKEVIA